MEKVTEIVAEIIDCPCPQTLKFVVDFGIDVSAEGDGFMWLVPLDGDRAVLYCYDDENLFEEICKKAQLAV